MSDTFVLRTKPLLRFTLEDNQFHIQDDSDPLKNSTHNYSELKEIKLIDEQTDELISDLSWVLRLLSVISIAGDYKTKAHFRLKVSGRRLKIWLINADLNKAHDLRKELLHRAKI